MRLNKFKLAVILFLLFCFIFTFGFYDDSINGNILSEGEYNYSYYVENIPLENPYNLYGRGNCCYFCWDMMNLYWPVMFKINREWDAKDWIKLEGAVSDDYRVVVRDLSDVRYGDFIVFPYSSRWNKGHVCFVLFVDVGSGVVVVVESSNYAGESYRYELNDCRYRVGVYEFEMLERNKVKVLGWEGFEGEF